MQEEETQLISKYSSGINIIIRLDSLWKDTHLHSRQGIYERWDADLDRIWLELARDLKEDKYKLKKQIFDKFYSDLKKIGGYYDKAPEGFKEISKEAIEKRSKVYEILMDKQLFLARLENDIGKGTTHEDEDDGDFD